MEDQKKDAEDNKLMGILAYFGILVLVPILTAKESPFARFHANQGLLLLIAMVAIWVINSVLWVLPLGWSLISLLTSLLYLGIFVLAIIGIINAAKGEMKELPIIGKYTILK
jgi:uncharacterized membrane protein